MPKSREVDLRQMSFDELTQQLDDEPGELKRLKFAPEDFGGELLSILSKGLYTNPLDCIREYVQNSVDAHAQNVTIKITGNSVMVADDGAGMNLEELLAARLFGISSKRLTEHVGFRGIGIYSGFDLCRRLRITSKKAGDPRAYIIVFEFADMRVQLEADRRRERGEHKTSLVDLLSEHTQIGRESSEFEVDQHFTTVELQDISDVHIKQLSNRPEMQRYLLQNLPIDFNDDFAFGSEINKNLQLHVPGYVAVRIRLESDGQPDAMVGKYTSLNVQAPMFGYIASTTGQHVAYYWACLTDTRDRVDKDVPPADRPQYEGFVYKMKGFTVGDRDRLRGMFKRRPQLYTWYTGEIYVLDSGIVPNAERNDFETNPQKRALELAVLNELSKLETTAIEYQARGVALERIEKYQSEVASVEEQVETNSQISDLDTYARLQAILDDLNRQKKAKITREEKQNAEDLVKRVDRLQRVLRKEVDNAIPEATRRRRAARTEALQAPLPSLELPPEEPKTLTGVLRDAGWQLEGQLEVIVNLIQESLADVLTMRSTTYRNLLNDIEAKLLASIVDESA